MLQSQGIKLGGGVKLLSYFRGCGGPTTNEWYLSSNGWVSRSITTAAH